MLAEDTEAGAQFWLDARLRQIDHMASRLHDRKRLPAVEAIVEVYRTDTMIEWCLPRWSESDPRTPTVRSAVLPNGPSKRVAAHSARLVALSETTIIARREYSAAPVALAGILSPTKRFSSSEGGGEVSEKA